MKVFTKIVAVLPYLIVFIASLYLPSDPDLGWHLKYGEYFFQHGSVLRDNTFSTMMPDFRWANVSWGTDVITYAAYAVGGFLGLTILGALVVMATFYFFSKAANLSLWDQTLLFPILLYLEKPLNNVSFRGQLMSMLLLGVLVYILSLSEKKPKIMYLTIPLFFIWVNLHGQFFLGLAFFGLWIGVTLLQKYFFIYKKSFKKVFVDVKYFGSIFFASLIVTFLNPFGPGVHLDAIGHLTSLHLKSIAEYLPFDMFSQVWWNHTTLGGFLILGMIFLFFKKKLNANIPHIVGAVMLYVLTFSVRRYAWPAYYLILPVLSPLAAIFKPDTKKATFILSSIVLLFVLTVTIVGKYPYTKFFTYSWDDYCQNYFMKCSPTSAEFLKEEKLSDNLFSLYSWGGWMIWNYPEVKPTIDGRMHIWIDEKGYSAFADYYDYEQNMKDIHKSSYNVVYMSPDKPLYNRMLKLVEDKSWKQVYEDQYAGIFVRK